jgi:hypothetical protein
MGMAMGQKLLTTLITVSVFLFSSFKGNDAVFSDLFVRNSGSYLIVQTQLQHAFDNDFQDIFKSGKTVDIWFNLEAKQRKEMLHKQVFRHSVQYDQLAGIYKIYLQEQRISRQVSSYEDMLKVISTIQYNLPLKHEWNNVELHVDAFLKKMKFAGYSKDMDLMMLWKLKKPAVNLNVDLKAYES